MRNGVVLWQDALSMFKSPVWDVRCPFCAVKPVLSHTSVPGLWIFEGLCRRAMCYWYVLGIVILFPCVSPVTIVTWCHIITDMNDVARMLLIKSQQRQARTDHASRKPAHNPAWRNLAWRYIAWLYLVWRYLAWRYLAWRYFAWRYLAWRGSCSRC